MSSAERSENSDAEASSEDTAAGKTTGAQDSIGGSGRLRLPEPAEKDEAPLALVALRDLFAASVLLSIFGGADTWARSSELGLAHFAVAIVGLVGGAALAAVGHEWGHFAGARLGGGHSPLKPVKAFPQVFDFDYVGNSAKSFRWMSIGGSVGNWGIALLLATLIPLGTTGPNALVAGAVGFSVFTAFVEFPVIGHANRGVPGLQALGMIPKDFTTRYLPQALGTALLVFLVL